MVDFFEAKRINKVRRDDFTGCKTLRKIQPMYLEFALKEGKFNWCVKGKRKDPLVYLHYKMQ